MRRLAASTILAVAAAIGLAAPVAAGDFPDQAGRPPACDVITALPKDVIGHLDSVNPAVAARLAQRVADACF